MDNENELNKDKYLEENNPNVNNENDVNVEMINAEVVKEAEDSGFNIIKDESESNVGADDESNNNVMTNVNAKDSTPAEKEQSNATTNTEQTGYTVNYNPGGIYNFL